MRLFHPTFCFTTKLLNRLATPSCSWQIECWMKTVDRLAGASQWLKMTLKVNSELTQICALRFCSASPRDLLTNRKFNLTHSRPQSPSFLGHVVGYRLSRVAVGTRMNLTRSHDSHMRFPAHLVGFRHFILVLIFASCWLAKLSPRLWFKAETSWRKRKTFSCVVVFISNKSIPLVYFR